MGVEIYVAKLPKNMLKHYKSDYFSIKNEDVFMSFSRPDDSGWQSWHLIKDYANKINDEYGDEVVLYESDLIKLEKNTPKELTKLRDYIVNLINTHKDDLNKSVFIFRLDH